MTNDIIALIANLALTLSFIVAVIFGIAQVKTTQRDRRERLTLETLRNFQTREFSELIQYVSSHDFPETAAELDTLPGNDRVIFIQFGQQMESLGLLVAERFLDVDLVDKTLGSLVTTAWEKYKPTILELRVKRPDPFLCEYFQWLAERIDERLQRSPRKPFYQ